MTVDWGKISGQVVFDSTGLALIEHTATGFSVMGTRSLLLTDHPAVYVHDTGGLGAPYVASAEPAAEPAVSVGLTDGSTRLRVRAELPDGRTIDVATIAQLTRDQLATLSELRGRLLPGHDHATFVTACAVSVIAEHDPSSGATQPADTQQAEMVAYVLVAEGRLQLCVPQVVVDWPLNRVTAIPEGRRGVRLAGGAVLAGNLITGATVQFATPQERDALVAAVTAGHSGQVATAGTSAPVTVRGLDSDAAQQVDCVLGESVLELQSRDGATVLASFDLADPQLRVAGTAAHFVIFHPAYGPVSVDSDSETFGQRLHAHPLLQAAADRTLATGPFPAEDQQGRPVACVATADGLRVKGPEVDVRVPYPAITTIVPETGDAPARLTVATESAEVTLVGQLELVRAVHTSLAAGGYATAEAATVPDLLRAAVGLEEDYFLTTVFGPCYELHAALLGGADADRLGEPVSLPDDVEARARIEALLHEGLAALARHFDQVALVLPAFVRHRDARLLAPVTGSGGEPDWLKEREAPLRQALAGPVHRAAAETGALLAQVERLRDQDPSALPKPGYTAAAMTLGAAALLNPVLAVAGAAQAYRQHSAAGKRQAELDTRLAHGWATAVTRWNALVGTTLPLLGYQLTENVFGLRWQVAQQVAAALRDCPAQRRPEALRAVAGRLARLDVLRRYPASAATRVRRGDIAEHLRSARDAISPAFPDL